MKRPTIFVDDHDDAAAVPAPARPNGKRFVTSAELADELGIQPQTVYAWRYRGGGPPFTRIGGAVRYERASVEAWLASRTGTTLAALNAAGVLNQ